MISIFMSIHYYNLLQKILHITLFNLNHYTTAVINNANAPSTLLWGTTYTVSDPIAIINPKYVINIYPGADINMQY